MGIARATGLSLDGWSASARVAPPWLWLLTASAAQSAGNLQARLPGTAAQVLRLAVPSSAGSQGPFVAAGVPALTVSAIGHTPAPAVDVIDTVSTDTLSRVGATVQRLVASIDTAPDNLARSGGTIFVTRGRTLPGGALELILAALLLPLAAVAGDLFAQGRRRRVPLWSGWLRYAMHLAPWLLLCAIVYLANLLSLLPHTPGAVTPPDSSVSHHPWYLRVALLVVVLLVAYYYAAAIERRLARRYPVNPRATIFVAHAALVLIGFFVFLVNPFSLLLLHPGRDPLAPGATGALGALRATRLAGPRLQSRWRSCSTRCACTWERRCGGTSSSCSRTGPSRPRPPCSASPSWQPPACSVPRCIARRWRRRRPGPGRGGRAEPAPSDERGRRRLPARPMQRHPPTKRRASRLRRPAPEAQTTPQPLAVVFRQPFLDGLGNVVADAHVRLSRHRALT